MLNKQDEDFDFDSWTTKKVDNVDKVEIKKVEDDFDLSDVIISDDIEVQEPIIVKSKKSQNKTQNKPKTITKKIEVSAEETDTDTDYVKIPRSQWESARNSEKLFLISTWYLIADGHHSDRYMSTCDIMKVFNLSEDEIIEAMDKLQVVKERAKKRKGAKN